MSQGVQYEKGTIQDSPWHPNRAAACRAQYASRGASAARWTFIEVCEDTCFCDNPVNPVMEANRVTYGNNFKSFSADQTSGVMTLSIDGNREWRNGCALQRPSGGTSPTYSNENAQWNWNHLLLNQAIDVDLDVYDKLELTADFRLADSAKSMAGGCPAGDTTGDGGSFNPPHVLLYLALEIQHDASPAAAGGELTSGGRPVIFYALVRLWSTHDGAAWSPGETGPWAGGDPAGDFVYLAASDDALGRYKLTPRMAGFQRYTIDVRQLAQEALAGRGQAMNRWVDPGHYRITGLYFGVEMWGGFGLTVEAKNLSLRGHNFTAQRCADWVRYWSPSLTDHYYATDGSPGGLPGYQLEGRISSTPTYPMNGSVPLYRYWNAALGDHYYATGLWPFGAGCTPPCGGGGWSYEGARAHVWTQAGAGRVPIFEFWNGTDHLYGLDPQEGPRAGYACSPGPCGTPAFHMAQ